MTRRVFVSVPETVWEEFSRIAKTYKEQPESAAGRAIASHVSALQASLRRENNRLLREVRTVLKGKRSAKGSVRSERGSAVSLDVLRSSWEKKRSAERERVIAEFRKLQG